jgi:hypothetical protein
VAYRWHRGSGPRREFLVGPFVGAGAGGGSGARVPRAWPGETVVCLATGPSLTADDVDYCRSRARVIAVNNAWQLAPWADALVASDAKWWRHHRPSFDGFKYSLQPGASQFGAQVLDNTGETGIETLPTGIRTGMNSGAAAINIAVHFGASRILLLGYDMGHDGLPSHFFGEHPQGLRASSPYGSFIEKFNTMVEPLLALGVAVVNCSRKTRLMCFERLPLHEALP